jgi:esterase/lipase superfamily enzyme
LVTIMGARPIVPRAGSPGRPWRLAGLLLVMALQGCATRAEGVLRPVAVEAAGSSQVSMLVVSTRAPSTDPGVVFSGARGDVPRTEVVTVSIPPHHRVGVVEWPRRPLADPRRDFATLAVTPTDRDQSLAWFEAQKSDGRVLIFVHGFNVTFESAVYHYAQLVHDAAPKAAPVLFTWPSRGSVTAYVYDRESANYSRDALEDLLRLAARSPDVHEVTLFAHSMGTWLAMEALRQYAIREGRVDPKIDNVILAAPDLDVDVFLRQFAALGPSRPHFTFLVSRDDHALAVSKILAGGVTRVGAVDITQEPYRSELEHTPDVTVVDMTRLRTGDRVNHGKFAASPQVVQLLGSQLIDGSSLNGARPGLGVQASAIIISLSEPLGVAIDAVTAVPVERGPTRRPVWPATAPIPSPSAAPSPVAPPDSPNPGGATRHDP